MDIKWLIRTVANFRKPGIRFRDITTLLEDAAGFHAVVEQLAANFANGSEGRAWSRRANSPALRAPRKRAASPV